MIYTIFVELHSQMLHTKFQNHKPYGSEEEDFLLLIAMADVTLTIYTNFHSLFLRMLHKKFGFDWPSGFREKDVSILWLYTCI